jgi:tetraacyldisaccharide 4'-kinase
MRRPLLLPLVPLYAAGLALREMRLQRGWEPVRKLQSPVISIGNLSTGGSGKTPLAIALARLLSERGFYVDVLSRGYGRTSREAGRVETKGTAEQYGDEPLLIARETGVPVYVAAERYEAGMLAEGDGMSDGRMHVHILDDGFQHRQLARDVDILLLNREDWHDHLLPAGNLREGLNAAKRADVLAISAEESGFESELRAWGREGAVWRLRRRMEIPQVDGPVVAFCGVARPEQFFAGLKAAGVTVAAQHSFADHHRYTTHDIARLEELVRRSGAVALLTTAKDRVRLGDLASRYPVRVVDLRTEIEDASQAMDWLALRLSARRVSASV